MIRAVRRPLLAVIAVAIVVGGWLAGPLLAGPADLVSQLRPSPTAPDATASLGVVPSPGIAPGPGGSPAGQPTPSVVPGGIGASPAAGIPHVGTTTATPMLRAALDAQLAQLRAKTGIPGISVAILFPDGTTWLGTAGLADVGAGRAVTPDTAFPVASVSKTFTAALILALVQEGRVRLDASARAYVPTLAIDPTITIGELLDHTSGLRDFFLAPGIDKALIAQPAQAWDAARSLSYLGKPFAKPGAEWHYANTNYLVLGLVAEAVGGAPVADQLRARFLAPLGLDHTYVQAVETPRGPVVHDYRFAGPGPTLPAIDLSDGTAVMPFTSVVTAAGAAGSIASTAGDLVRWAKSLYAGTALARTTRNLMIDDVLRTVRFKPTTAYGLGVQAVVVDGRPTLGHSGRYLGARAVVRWLTEDRMAIAVLTNQSRADPNAIAASLLQTALAPQVDCTSCANLP